VTPTEERRRERKEKASALNCVSGEGSQPDWRPQAGLPRGDSGFSGRRLPSPISGSKVTGIIVSSIESSQRLSTYIEGSDTQPRTVTIPPASPVELIGRQLSDRERDPVFRDCMATATVMAQSLLG
jgi:hypothetical protein